FSDFYKTWMEMKLQIQAMTSSVSSLLSNCLQTRERNLIQNDVSVASLYFDPRLRRLLNVDPGNIMVARNHLKQIIRKIYGVTDGKNLTSNHNALDENANHNERSSSLLSTFLNAIEVIDIEKEQEDEVLQNEYNKMNNYNPKPLDISTDLMTYWKEKKYACPILYKLASIIQSVPATQVTV
ncbi:hypothetical protein KR084_001704, partial [Drosophila pseudotakahashii]